MNRIEFLEELENKISSFYPVLAQNNNSENFGEALFYSHDMRNDTFIKLIHYQELETFNDIVNFIVSYSNISIKYSVKFIEKQLTELFHNLLKDNTNISNNINNFYTFLINNSIDEWFIVSEIENIRLLDNGPFQLIDCTIKLLVLTL